MSTTQVDQNTIDTITLEMRRFGTDIKGMEDTANKALSEMRGLIDQHGKKASEQDAVLKERLDKFATDYEMKTSQLEGAVDTLKAVMDRPASGGWKGEEGMSDAERAFKFHKAKLVRTDKLTIDNAMDPAAVDVDAIRNWEAHYGHYLRRDDRALRTSEFHAAMQTGSNPDGGYLVPEQSSSRIITRIFESSPIRQYASVDSISGKDMTFGRDEGENDAGWVGETTPPTETATAKLGESKIIVHEMFAEPKATQQLLEDAGVDVEAWLARKTADKFGRLEASAFVVGDGNNKPRGYLTYPDGTSGAKIEQIVSGNATALTADGIWDLVFSIKDGYAANARHFMKRTTVRDVIKMKDGQGNYLWTSGNIRDGVPSALADYPVVRAEDMPQVGAGSLAIAFGDMSACYQILDRLGIVVLRDPLTAKPFVKFYSRRRVGGDVLNFEALKIQRVSA
jgi:HK97 family phage major capsid protein